ncbi:hypothetical protein SOVF_035420 [Spinacia oleracea]|nr:hypothetical protein SOVF_035420 [Spinacia oleracea]
MHFPPLKFLRPFLSISPYRSSSLFSSLLSKTLVIRTFAASQGKSLQNPTSSPHSRPAIVDQVLSSLSSEPSSAIGLFEWSEKVLGINHSLHSYTRIAHILLFHRLFPNAHQLFDKMLKRFGDLEVFEALNEGFRTYGTNPNTVYSFLLAGLFRNCRFDGGVSVFLQLSKMGIDVAPYALRIMLDSLVSSRCVDGIMNILDEMCLQSVKKLKQGFNVYEFVMRSFVSNHLFEMALNFHRKMIDRGFVPNTVDCNKMLKILCKEDSVESASQFFHTMLEIGPGPNLVTFSTMIDSFCKRKRLNMAFKLYNLMLQKGISPDLIVYSVIIDGSLKNGKLEEGHHLFTEALKKGIKLDVVVFGSIMDSYVRVGNIGKVIEVYRRMFSEGISPSIVINGILIKGLCQDGRVHEATGVFGEYLKRGIEPSVLAYCNLIDGFCKLGNLKEAFIWYKKMLECGHVADLVVYAVLINGLSKQGYMDEAIQLFFQALMKGIQPNVYIFNSLLDGYCRLNQMKNMMKVNNLRSMMNIVPDSVTQTLFLKSLVFQKRNNEALILFFQMVKLNSPLDAITYCTLIHGFCEQKNLKAVLYLFQHMQQITVNLNPDIAIYNVLLRSFFNGFQVEDATNTFLKLLSHGPDPDIVTYNTMICGYCISGKFDEAIQLYETLPIRRTVITYSILINAFCKKGRINEAMLFFRRMLDEGLKPTVVTYNCLVDGYFKFCGLESAFELFEEMCQNKIDPNIVSFSIIMDGLCKKGLIEAALSTFDAAIYRGLLPDVVAYSIVIHGCCRVGRLVEARMFYERMLMEGVVPDQVLEQVIADYNISRSK